MIRISLGNVGSGKTVCEVREMFLNHAKRKTFSNIKTKLKHQINISPDMIIQNEVVGTKNKKDGTIEEVTKKTLNKEFWMGIKEPINVVIDEAHSIINARRSMSKTNEIVGQWLALIRRVLGSSENGYGELVFITQLPRKLDVIAREMATQVRYHVCHFIKGCHNCGSKWRETSEIPEQLHQCPMCSGWNIKKFNHQIEVWCFPNMYAYQGWSMEGISTFYKHYIITDIEKYFPLYDTLQWDNLFEDHY